MKRLAGSLTNSTTIFISLIFMTLLSAPFATAQIVTETVQPNRLDEAPIPDTDLDRRDQSAGALPSTEIEAAPGPNRAIIASVRVVGSSLPQASLEAATRDFVGRPLDAAQLRALADAVSKTYASTDIALYTILVPKQDFADGVVKLAAIENHIEEIFLSGGATDRSTLTQSYASAMAAERPLTRPTLERYLLLMNAVPGATTTPKILSGDRVNTVKMALETSHEPVESELTITTRGAARLGRTQLKGDLYLNGWGYEGNQTRLTLASSSDFQRFLSAAAAHSYTFGPSGIALSGTLGYVRTRPTGAFADGDAIVAGVQTSIPLVRTVRRRVTLGVGIDGVDSENALFGQVVSNDSTRVLRASISASGKSGKLSWGGGLSLSEGLDALGADISNTAFASADFSKLTTSAVLIRPIGKSWKVRTSVKGQYSDSRLPGAELISFGGAGFGRAYESGAVSGDSGLAGSVEVTKTLGGDTPVIKQSELYAFADRGQVWFTNRPGFVLDDMGFASAGVGLRLPVSKKTLVAVEAANPIEVSRNQPEQSDWRIAFNLQSKF